MALLLVFDRDHRQYERGDILSIHADDFVPRPGDQEMIDDGLLIVARLPGYPPDLNLDSAWNIADVTNPGKRNVHRARIWSVDVDRINLAGIVPRAAIERKDTGQIPSNQANNNGAKQRGLVIDLIPPREASTVRNVPPRPPR